MTTLIDQTVLITGANRGLGREFVEQFLTRGVAKVYAAARNPESITTDDPRVVPLQLDVIDPDSVARVAATAHDLSIVVNNAGGSTPTPVLSGDTANLRRELEVNLFGPLAVTTAFAARLADRCGAVVNVASVLSWLGIGGSYSVSKAALWSATDSMRLGLTPRGVHVGASTWGTSTPIWPPGSTRRSPARRRRPTGPGRPRSQRVSARSAECPAQRDRRDHRLAAHQPVHHSAQP